MNLDQLASRVFELRTVLEEELNREVETIALDGTSLVTQRVSETGTNADGGRFTPYTKAWELKKRQAVSTAKKEGAKKRQARKTAAATPDKPVGRYKGFVDFTFTGQMLSSIGPVEVREGRGKSFVRVAGRDEFTQKKMDGNDEHRPGWFRLSDEEIALLAEQSRERVSLLVQRFLTT